MTYAAIYFLLARTNVAQASYWVSAETDLPRWNSIRVYAEFDYGSRTAVDVEKPNDSLPIPVVQSCQI